MLLWFGLLFFFFFKQKTAYEMRISDWSSDVCSSDLSAARGLQLAEARFERIEPLGRIRSGLPRLLVTIPRRLPAPLRLRFSCRRPVNVILLIDPLSDALIGSAADDRPDLCLQRRLDAAAHDAAGRRHFERLRLREIGRAHV